MVFNFLVFSFNLPFEVLSNILFSIAASLLRDQLLKYHCTIHSCIHLIHKSLVCSWYRTATIKRYFRLQVVVFLEDYVPDTNLDFKIILQTYNSYFENESPVFQ